MKIRRALALALCLCFLFAPALAQEEVVLTMMGLEADGSGRSWSDNLFFERMREKTGVSFVFDQHSDPAAFQAAKDAAFSPGGTLPDVLFKANLTPAEEMAYAKSGQLVDLAPYLTEYAPNLSAILEKRADWRAIITQPDGTIASLPVLSGADRQCAVWINSQWLEALDLPMPRTIDEYTQTLRAFRDKDPNGNGKKDEIPLSLVGPFEAKFLLHAFGLAPNDYNLYVDADGQVRFAPFEAGYYDFVKWLSMAREESLIERDAFRQLQSTRTTAQGTQTDVATLGGMVTIAPYTVVNMDMTTQYAALLPLEHEGKRVYRQLLNGVGRGAFAVTRACENIPAALAWVDALYTEEGGRLAFAGLEGEDYTVAADGSWKWNAGEAYEGLAETVEKRIIAGDSRTPGLEPAAFMRKSEIEADNHARKQVDLIRPYLAEPFPVTWPADEARQARIAALQEALGTCVDTAIAEFAMGIREINDENWQAFQEELRALGAEEFCALWQATYDERAN